MTSARFSRRLALLAALATSFWLAACGGGGGDGGNVSLRALNLSSDLPSLDLYANDAAQATALSTGSLSTYASLSANTYTLRINGSGNSTALFTGSYTLAKDAHYTAVVWGPQSSLHLSTLPEDDDQSKIATGNTRIRFFNATTETGTLNIYLTAANTDLSSTTPTQATLAGGVLGGFKDIPAGSYRLRVTGVTDPSDVRLDVPALQLDGSKSSTLIITAGGGGVLVNGTLLVQQGAQSAFVNTNARVRVVASVDSAGVVNANVGGKQIANNLVSPAIGQYTLVPAGSAAPATVTINGATVLNGPQALVAGGDYTLLAYGATGAAQVNLIADDNRLPLNNTSVKVRLINGAATLPPLTLKVNNLVYGAWSNIPAGTASSYQQLASVANATIEVDASLDPVYLNTNIRTNGDTLSPLGVYTVFLLSGRATPTGVLLPERP